MYTPKTEEGVRATVRISRIDDYNQSAAYNFGVVMISRAQLPFISFERGVNFFTIFLKKMNNQSVAHRDHAPLADTELSCHVAGRRRPPAPAAYAPRGCTADDRTVAKIRSEQGGSAGRHSVMIRPSSPQTLNSQ
jgi:hypothetical protein